MRVSTAQMFQQGINAILDQQAKMAHTEQQLATGRRILTPADDPVAAAQILDISEDLELLDQYQRNANLAQGQLGLEEQALTDVGNLLQRVRELTVQANNASQSAADRRAIGTEIAGRLDELLALANTRDSNGEYIFAGFQAQSPAFSRVGNAIVFDGDSGQRSLQLGAGSQVAVRDSGRDVFLAVPAGNGKFTVAANGTNTGNAVAGPGSAGGAFVAGSYTIEFAQATSSDPITYQVLDASSAVIASGNYTAGESISFAGANLSFTGTPADGDSFAIAAPGTQDMFSSLQNLVDALAGAEDGSAEVAQLNTTLAQGLENLDRGIENINTLRAGVGVRLNHVESQLNINESFNLQLKETLSGIQDLDYAEAISRFNLELTALQAAQQAYVKMQGLSLFNYL